ncbi:MAG: phosphoribosylformylglycinamidine synthase subunit PurS [Actinomycetia bacterium]|nr:phosphoribosylformylglycinamidine synthase subunit PurS [Actinomycetes bacterium]MDQ1653399.1 phosphoribosylformylglycinamidine synthase subunit PurS [Cryptosporangiaceae bacterium]
MARVVVDVMLKPEILDPQGQAIANALPSLGFSGITAVRQGKRFEVEVAGDLTEDALSEITRVAGTLLSNPVIEDFAIRGELTEETALTGDLPSPSQAAGVPVPIADRAGAPTPAAEAAAQQGEQYPPAGVTSDLEASPVPSKDPA